MKRRKPRSLKANGIHNGMDMCPHCLSFNCDPMCVSDKAKTKFDKRLTAGLCPSCGKPVINQQCGCKSNIRNQTIK